MYTGTRHVSTEQTLKESKYKQSVRNYKTKAQVVVSEPQPTALAPATTCAKQHVFEPTRTRHVQIATSVVTTKKADGNQTNEYDDEASHHN